MLHATQYSLKAFIESLAVFTEVQWHYTGMTYPTTLPFCTVEHLNTGVATLDKGSTHTSNEYNFQVGIFAKSAGDLAKLIDIVTKKLAGDLPLFNTDGNAPVEAGTMRSEVLNVVPMPVDSTEAVSTYNRAYLDVQIKHLITL